jgi:hypothetical protein
MESSAFCRFVIQAVQINARNLECITRIDKKYFTRYPACDEKGTDKRCHHLNKSFQAFHKLNISFRRDVLKKYLFRLELSINEM